MCKYKQPDPPALTTEEAADISTAITSLVTILRSKSWQLPSRFAVTTYNILITFLENHYKKPKMLEKANSIRLKVSICLKHHQDFYLKISEFNFKIWSTPDM